MSLVLAAALSGCVSGGSGAALSTPPPSPTAFKALMNGARVSNSLGPLTTDTRLTNAAQGHADDMSIRGYFSHTSPEGKTVGDRIHAQGYNYCWAGENIAMGYATPADAFAAWMASPGHKANMLSSQAQEFGLGHAPSGQYWVLVLAKPGC